MVMIIKYMEEEIKGNANSNLKKKIKLNSVLGLKNWS
jgi:hypothetical protein